MFLNMPGVNAANPEQRAKTYQIYIFFPAVEMKPDGESEKVSHKVKKLIFLPSIYFLYPVMPMDNLSPSPLCAAAHTPSFCLPASIPTHA